MQGIKPERSPDLSLPLRYVVAVLAAFVLFATAVPFVGPDFLRTYHDPHVFAPFEPVTLFSVLAAQGFQHDAQPIGNGDYRVIFQKP